MKYRVKLARRAKDDRERAFEWYSTNYSGEFASRWLIGVTQAIESLSVDPYRYPTAIENDFFPFELRELLYGTKRNKHRVLYTVTSDVVNVLHIRHSAQRELGDEDL